MEGKGKYIFDDDSYTIGEFKNNKRNGKGKQYDNNNNLIYDGLFVDDQREGFGKLFDNNKILYEGLFVKNEIEGNGKYYIKDNLSIEVYYPPKIYYSSHFFNFLLNKKIIITLL